MTRKQKIVLIVLGVLDVGVIAALAGIVIHSMRPTPAAPTPVPAYLSACEQSMLDALATMPASLSETPIVAWDDAHLYVTLQAVYPTATPPDESAQLLWMALDSIAAVLLDGCTVPPTITIALTAQGQTETTHYLAQLAGQDMTAWMAGTLPEADLAAQSHFRQTRE
jgi:hypothetical protein